MLVSTMTNVHILFAEMERYLEEIIDQIKMIEISFEIFVNYKIQTRFHSLQLTVR